MAQVSATLAMVSSKVPPDWSHYQTQILHIFSQSTNVLLSTYYVLATAPGAVDAPKNKATLFMLLRLTLVRAPCRVWANAVEQKHDAPLPRAQLKPQRQREMAAFSTPGSQLRWVTKARKEKMTDGREGKREEGTEANTPIKKGKKYIFF